MTEHFDVVVVGARCSGSSLAALLARRGLRVAVVEQATFPQDTLSTHVFQADALSFLDRLGVMERLRSTGAPLIDRVDYRFEDVRVLDSVPLRAGDPGGFVCVRRFLLDPILAEAAEEAGAEVRMATTVTGLLEESGRVAGVRAVRDGTETEIRARLVVGADGRNSTIAKLSGSRKYNVTGNERFSYWSFFTPANAGSEPTAIFHRWADRFVFSLPADSDLRIVAVIPELGELKQFRRDLEGSFLEHVRSCEPVAEAIAHAHRATTFYGILRFAPFFRDPCGPGWVLVGDAGHFKDPTPARGIGDAFRQADALAPRIVAGLDGSGEGLDQAMSVWGRWRDHELAEQYWLAQDMGKAGRLWPVVPEVASRLHAQGKFGSFIDLFTHRSRPSSVMSPLRVLGATGRLLARRGCDRGVLLREVGAAVAESTRRRRLNHRPEYATAGLSSRNVSTAEVDDDSS